MIDIRQHLVADDDTIEIVAGEIRKKMSLHAEMYQLENGVATTISVADVFHPIRNFVTGAVSGWTFIAGGAGTITDTETSGGLLRCTDPAHGLSTGDCITLVGMGTAAHNGHTLVTIDGDGAFICDNISWAADNDTGSWIQGAALIAGASAAGMYSLAWTASISPAVNNHIYTGTALKNCTLCCKSRSRIKSGGAGEFTSMCGSGFVENVVAGDIISLSVKNVGADGNLTVRHADFKLVKI